MKRTTSGYSHRAITKKMDQKHIIGFSVLGQGSHAAATVYPIYRGDVYVEGVLDGDKTKTIVPVTTFETGAALNGRTFHEDPEGCALAAIAFHAVNALRERQRLAELAQASKKRRKKS